VADFVPAVNADDFYADSQFLAFSAILAMGSYDATTIYSTYVRFPNVTVPQGATITSAILSFTSSGSYLNDTCNLICHANDVDDAVAPIGDGVHSTNFNALSLTDGVEWSSVEHWTSAGTVYQAPEIKTIIQTVVNRDGWASGNALAVIVKDNGSSTGAKRYARSKDANNGLPTLTITYTGGGVTTSDGDSTIPVPTITASMDGVVASLPLLSLVNCYVDVPHSDVIESLPIFTISATAIQSTVIAGDCTLPILTMTSTSGFQTSSDADVDFPALTASSTSLTGEIHTGDCDVPFFTISATLLNGGISQGVASLPFLTFSGRTINTGTVSESFPVLTINGYAHGPLLHTLDETLPLLQIVATLVHASTTFRCYVLNTENSAITEYDNFPFNSFATFKGKHLAAGSNGITLLEGNKDNSTDINAYLNVGNNDFDLSNIKKITDAYLSMKGDGSYYLTVTSDDGTPHSYLLSATTGDRIKNLKTNVGKGKKGRFFELELSNIAGADFELFDMVLNVELLQRKI
jgi:hypothetical protein